MIHDELEPTTKAGGRALAAQLADVATRAVERGRATHDRLLAIGISTPGVVDRETGRVRLAYNVSPDGALDPLARRRLALRRAGAAGQQHQPRRAGREVVRAGPRRLDDGVHRHRGRRRDGDHHARRARPRRPRRGRRDRLPARSSAIPSIRGTSSTAGSRTRSAPPACWPPSLRARPAGPTRSSTAQDVFELARHRGWRRPRGGGAHRGAPRLGHRHRVRDPRSGARRPRRGYRLQPAAAEPGARRRGRARPAHRPDRDQPAGRPGGAARRDRLRAARGAQPAHPPGRRRCGRGHGRRRPPQRAGARRDGAQRAAPSEPARGEPIR